MPRKRSHKDGDGRKNSERKQKTKSDPDQPNSNSNRPNSNPNLPSMKSERLYVEIGCVYKGIIIKFVHLKK